MTYHAEVAKEYLRNVFNTGALDVTRDFETVRGFVQIMAGEAEALFAIHHCTFLTAEQIDALVRLAIPDGDAVRQFKEVYRR